MDYLCAKKILIDEAIIVTDLKADSKIQALRESVKLLYDKKKADSKIQALRKSVKLLYDKVYGHDCIGDLLARIIEHEKRGSYLIAEGVALPHLYISDGEFEERVGWFIIKNGIEYGNLKEKVFVFLLCIGPEEFVKSITTFSLELCKSAGFANRVRRLYANEEMAKSIILFECYISSRLLTLFKLNKQKEMTIEGDDVVSIDLKIENKLGLHARASAKLVTLAESFESEIILQRDKRSANAKKIMDIMLIGAAKGTKLRLKAKGQDAKQAIDALSELIQRKFGESD